MTREEIYDRLDSTGIRREKDRVVPINGQQVKLPYQVVRTKETEDGDDFGRVRIQRTDWTVALFTTDRDDSLTSEISQALSDVGKVEITRYPDGQPYQTNLKFTTREIMTQEG